MPEVFFWERHLSSILPWGGALLTGLFTLLGVWLANRSSLKQLTVKLQHESDREAREALRARLEELYSLVALWSYDAAAHYLPYLRVMDGELTYNEALDIELGRKAGVDASRMFTLAELYFPSAHGALEKMKTYRDKAASLHSDFKAAHKLNGEPSPRHARALREVLDQFVQAIEQYKRELSVHAKTV